MSVFYFLDLVLFFYVMYFVFSVEEGAFVSLGKSFSSFIPLMLGSTQATCLSICVAGLLFVFLVILCFFCYFPHSINLLGAPEFTAVFAFLFWLSSFLSYVSGIRFSMYLTSGGYSYAGSLFMLAIEFLSEFSRPISLTIRLTVNIMVGHMVVNAVYALLFLKKAGGGVLLLFGIGVECVVFMIQSYIFTRLIVFYLNE
uniref:ATP synthase subunit a n=1 Tax=Rhigonema thysanophora TaxID=435730 RepID=X2CVB2_9BILA|nr:ATP synthase F0 subunit 6 [Rhigonema thysanophora]AGZ90412.1 ATP synthase F0 subunit 6 [Rhigonema thysanophora]